MVAEMLQKSYDLKIYFHSIKKTLYLIKYIFIISSFFHYIKIYFFIQSKQTWIQ